jgi:hypothetical protein
MRVTGVALLLLVPAIGLSQQFGAPPIKKSRFPTSAASLLGIRAPFLQLDVSGTEWIVKVEATPENISYIATASKDWLRPGMLLRYTGANEKGDHKEPLKELTVFSLRPGYGLGIMDEGDGTFFVAGVLRSVKKDRFFVNAAGRKTRIQLAEDVTIHVDLNTLEFAQPGDQVKVEGWYFQEGKAVGDKVSVTASERLEAQGRKRRKSRRRRKDSSNN